MSHRLAALQKSINNARKKCALVLGDPLKFQTFPNQSRPNPRFQYAALQTLQKFQNKSALHIAEVVKTGLFQPFSLIWQTFTPLIMQKRRFGVRFLSAGIF